MARDGGQREGYIISKLSRRLLATYGGRESEWVKKSSPTIEIAGEH